jgi:hypothetical protein
MMQAILWKEYREQRVIWIALAALAVLILLPALQFLVPEGFQRQQTAEMLVVVPMALAWVQGMVSGGLLLAGEVEIGTLAFLDGLPGPRRRLWWAKVLSGLGWVLAQPLWLVAVSSYVHMFERPEAYGGELALLTGMAVVGYGWGLFASAFTGSVLGVIGLAVGMQWFAYPLGVVASGILLLPACVVFEDGDYLKFAPVLAPLFLLVVPYVASYLCFTRPDRQRDPESVVESQGRPTIRWLPMLWMTWYQLGWLALGVPALALLAGFLMPAHFLVTWPVTTLILGVLCGATAFLDEQQTGSFRFLGEQRFPLGKLWLVKVGFRFALAILAAVLVLAAFSVATFLHLFPWNERPAYGPLLFHLTPPVVFLGLWLVTGFAVGQVCGLLFRNALVAIVVGFAVSALLTGIWLPSLLGGGAAFLPLLLVPLVLLAAGRVLVVPWAGGRLVSWRVALGLVGVAILCLLIVAGGLWYRVVEVPDVPEPEPLAAYLAGLPTPEQNEAGELTRSACARLGELMNQEGLNRNHIANRLGERGRPNWKEDIDLGKLLDQLCKDKWMDPLAAAAELPVGVTVDPRRLTLNSTDSTGQLAVIAGTLLADRGLQLQERGDPAAFVRYLKIGLALCRNLEHRAPRPQALLSRQMRHQWMTAVEYWLEKLDGEPKLLRQALNLVRESANDGATELEQKWAEYIILLNTSEVPGQIPVLGKLANEDPVLPGLIELAWATPWERERLLRLIRVVCWGEPYQVQQVEMRYLLVPYHFAVPNSRQERAQMLTDARLRATLLMLALRLYQAEEGKPAARLAALVPHYLPEIPADPFDGAPFRYRLSQGEEIEWPEEPAPPNNGAAGPAGGAPGMPGMPPGAPFPAPAGGMPHVRKVPAGQGILWCCGPDRVDNGGKRQMKAWDESLFLGVDLIFLVPLPAGKGG